MYKNFHSLTIHNNPKLEQPEYPSTVEKICCDIFTNGTLYSNENNQQQGGLDLINTRAKQNILYNSIISKFKTGKLIHGIRGQESGYSWG